MLPLRTHGFAETCSSHCVYKVISIYLFAFLYYNRTYSNNAWIIDLEYSLFSKQFIYIQPQNIIFYFISIDYILQTILCTCTQEEKIVNFFTCACTSVVAMVTCSFLTGTQVAALHSKLWRLKDVQSLIT
jgi:hypothetical protein